MNTIKEKKLNYFEIIQDISRNKDALSVQTTHVMAAVWHSVQPGTSGAGDRGIYLKKLSLAVNCMAKTREICWSLFAQVWFALADFWVICSQDCAWRIFQFAQLCSKS
jgi:hypothetical protein